MKENPKLIIWQHGKEIQITDMRVEMVHVPKKWHFEFIDGKEIRVIDESKLLYYTLVPAK